MKRYGLGLMYLLAVITAVSGCMSDNNRDEEKITENETAIQQFIAADSMASSAVRDSSGLHYIIRKRNASGEKAKRGDAASVRFNGYLLDGTKVLSVKNDSTFAFPVEGYTTFPGLERAIYLLRTGEKATVMLPYYLAFGNVDQVNIPAYSVIRLEMEFVKTRTEVQQINEFLDKKKFTVSERSPDNLVIIRTNTVAGDTLGVGKSVSVKYVGKFLTETKFDEGTYPITTGTTGTVAGFDRAVRRMRKGEKAIVIFPSSLGYGAQGRQSIPGYAPLMFELEIL